MSKQNQPKEISEVQFAQVPSHIYHAEKGKKILLWRNSNIDIESEEWGQSFKEKLKSQFNKLKQREKQIFCQKKINAIRWKKQQKQDQKQQESEKKQEQQSQYQNSLMSNANILEWEDGSLGLLIGSTVYEISQEAFSGLYATTQKDNDLILAVQNPIEKKIQVNTKARANIQLE